MLYKLLKILGYERCAECKSLVHKSKTSGVGYDSNIGSFSYCKPCSDEIAIQLLQGKEYKPKWLKTDI